jgi:hypothetical protein
VQLRYLPIAIATTLVLSIMAIGRPSAAQAYSGRMQYGETRAENSPPTGKLPPLLMPADVNDPIKVNNSPDTPRSQSPKPKDARKPPKKGSDLAGFSALATPPDDLPGTGDKGYDLTRNNFPLYTGVAAGMEVENNIVLPTNKDIVIYAPTMKPAGRACPEAVVVHWVELNSHTLYHNFGFWDHCTAGSWITWYDTTNSTFRSKYIRHEIDNVNWSMSVYIIPVSSRCWRGYIFNYNTGQMDILSGTNALCGTLPADYDNNGWTMWESHRLMDTTPPNCLDLPNLYSYGIMQWDQGGQQWVLLNALGQDSVPFQYGACGTNGTYGWSLPWPSQWIALTDH